MAAAAAPAAIDGWSAEQERELVKLIEDKKFRKQARVLDGPEGHDRGGSSGQQGGVDPAQQGILDRWAHVCTLSTIHAAPRPALSSLRL